MIVSNSALKATMLLTLAVWTVPAFAASPHCHGFGPHRLAGVLRPHPVKAVTLKPGYPRLALTGGQVSLDRPYDESESLAADRPMPTSVSYRFSKSGPMGVVGYRVFNDGHPLDWHDVNAAAAGSRFGAPDGVMGASLSYAFK